MARRSWIRALLSAAEAHASLPIVRPKPLRAGSIRVVDRGAPIDFHQDRAQFEVEILNADAFSGKPWDAPDR
jgi:hypothetical protein